jgi:hypothetical protein
MALFNECMPQCAQKVFDTADIVRDRDLSPTIPSRRYDPQTAHASRNASVMGIVAARNAGARLPMTPIVAANKRP